MKIRELQSMKLIYPYRDPFGLDKAKKEAEYFIKQDIMSEISNHIKINYVYDAKRDLWRCVGSFTFMEDDE